MKPEVKFSRAVMLRRPWQPWPDKYALVTVPVDGLPSRRAFLHQRFRQRVEGAREWVALLIAPWLGQED